MNKKRTVIAAIGVLVLISVLYLNFGPKEKSALEHAVDQPKIAVVYIDGAISGARSPANLFSEDGGAQSVIRQLHEAAADPGVRAIVLRVNSPGGSSTAAEEIGDEIKKIRAKGKRITTSMGDTAASAAYWIAACTDKIYANPSTLTGSIGVYMPYTNWEELYKKIGIRQEKIKSGAHKDILSPDRPMTQEERAILQTIVDEIYEGFITIVAEGRGMTPEDVRKLADGRVYTGKQAQSLGLVDEIGNLYDAIDDTAAAVGIEGKPVVKEYGKDNPLRALLSSQIKTALLRELLGASMPEEAVWSMPPALPEKW